MTSAVPVVERSSDLAWEQCARLLFVLTSEELMNLQTTVNTIIGNILQNPQEIKFSRLRCTNSRLQKDILSKNGGLELLLAIGFQMEYDEIIAEKFLQFPIMKLLAPRATTDITTTASAPLLPTTLVEMNDIPEYVDILQAAGKWLENTINMALDCIALKQEHNITLLLDIPAHHIIQLQLPAQKIVYGGFLTGDYLLDVYQFALSFFHENR
jgi:hypothetical protein